MRKLLIAIATVVATFTTASAASACPTACGMKYKVECKNGNILYSDSNDVAERCDGNKQAQKPVPHVKKHATVVVKTQKAIKADVVTTSTPKLIRPTPPACVKGQADFTRWADPVLARHGLTVICDKNYGGLNLKPANSGTPTKVEGYIVRFNKAPSFGPQTKGFGYYEVNGDLYVVTARGTFKYGTWGMTKVK